MRAVYFLLSGCQVGCGELWAETSRSSLGKIEQGVKGKVLFFFYPASGRD